MLLLVLSRASVRVCVFGVCGVWCFLLLLCVLGEKEEKTPDDPS